MRAFLYVARFATLVAVPSFPAWADNPRAPERKTIWVGHTFIGGPKCVHAGPVRNFEPPGFAAEKARLLRAGVRVEREYFRDGATCEACHTCPNYQREILFEIAVQYLELSDKAGYRRVTPPAHDELKEYEDRKKFRPKPDTGPRED